MATPISVRNFSSTALPTQITTNIDGSVNTTNIPVVSTAGYPPTPFTAAFERATQQQEFVLVTSVPDANHFIVVRGYDGTPPVPHLAPATFEHTVGAIDYRESNQHNTDSTRDDHLQYSPLSAIRPYTGVVAAPGFSANAAGNVGRYMGSHTGPPTVGTYLANDYISDPINRIFWFCIAAGTPGTWSSTRVQPCARIYATGQSVLANGTWVQIALAGVDHALGGCTASASTIHLPISGIWQVSCNILYQTSNNPAGPGRYVAAVYRNGAQVRQYDDSTSTDAAYANPGGVDTGQYAAGDAVTLWGWQNSGGLEGSYGAGTYTNLAVQFVSYTS